MYMNVEYVEHPLCWTRI